MASFGFSVGDFITLGVLALELRRAYASAPIEYRSLAGDLEIFNGLVSQLENDVGIESSSLRQCSPQQKQQLVAILQAAREVLESLRSIRDRFQRFQTRPSVWDRLWFPSAEVRLLQARLHVQIFALKLFLGSLTTDILGRIMNVIEERGRSDQANWTTFFTTLAERGIPEREVEPYREQLEEYVQAVNEVAESERALSTQPNSQANATNPFQSEPMDNATLTGNTESILDGRPPSIRRRPFSTGPPRAGLLRSRICEGALSLQNSRSPGIQQKKKGFFSDFPGRATYRLKCPNCWFVGYQDMALDSLIEPTNTPLYFSPRQTPLKSTSPEYHLDIHMQNRDKIDGLFYRTIFFWKCHVKALIQTSHNNGQYECPFCSSEAAWGIFHNRADLLEHILTSHVQNQPSSELRQKFKCWIANSPALYEHEHQNTIGRDYDILLPRPYTRAEAYQARLARDRNPTGFGISQVEPPEYSSRYGDAGETY
jgi:hypothetical protein